MLGSIGMKFSRLPMKVAGQTDHAFHGKIIKTINRSRRLNRVCRRYWYKRAGLPYMYLLPDHMKGSG